MTAALDSELRTWGSMPGWGIVADLTPPELISGREMMRLRKIIAGLLALVVVGCATGYGYAWMQNRSAQSALDAANAHGADLTHAQARYSGVTVAQSTITGIRAKVATLMKTDVDVAKLLTTVRGALPGSMAITQLSVTFTSGSTAPGAAAASSAGGHAVIGKVMVSGAGRTLDDLSAYVDALSAIPGVANVMPTSNTATKEGTQFNLSFDLTDQLYSHRYDPAKGAASTAGSK